MDKAIKLRKIEAIMKFRKEDLQDLVYDESTVLTKIRDEQVGSSRCTIEYNLIFRFEDAYYSAPYSIGSTEQQDQQAFEYEPDIIECFQVWPEIIETVKFTDQDPGYTAEGLRLVEARL